jgi:hypothetical protein
MLEFIQQAFAAALTELNYATNSNFDLPARERAMRSAAKIALTSLASAAANVGLTQLETALDGFDVDV